MLHSWIPTLSEDWGGLDNHFWFPVYFTIQVKNTSSLPVALASVNLVARAKAIPLRIQAKPSTYRTKSGPWGQNVKYWIIFKVFKKVLVQPTTVVAFTHQLLFQAACNSSLLFHQQLHWGQVGSSCHISFKTKQRQFHKHEVVPQVSPEYQTLHLHWTFAQDSAAISGTTKFRVTAPFWPELLQTYSYSVKYTPILQTHSQNANSSLDGANIYSEIYDGMRHAKDHLQGGFFNWSAQKMTKCQTLWKFWHLNFFEGIYM